MLKLDRFKIIKPLLMPKKKDISIIKLQHHQEKILISYLKKLLKKLSKFIKKKKNRLLFDYLFIIINTN